MKRRSTRIIPSTVASSPNLHPPQNVPTRYSRTCRAPSTLPSRQEGRRPSTPPPREPTETPDPLPVSRKSEIRTFVVKHLEHTFNELTSNEGLHPYQATRSSLLALVEPLLPELLLRYGDKCFRTRGELMGPALAALREYLKSPNAPCTIVDMQRMNPEMRREVLKLWTQQGKKALQAQEEEEKFLHDSDESMKDNPEVEEDIDLAREKEGSDSKEGIKKKVDGDTQQQGWQIWERFDAAVDAAQEHEHYWQLLLSDGREKLNGRERTLAWLECFSQRLEAKKSEAQRRDAEREAGQGRLEEIARDIQREKDRERKSRSRQKMRSESLKLKEERGRSVSFASTERMSQEEK